LKAATLAAQIQAEEDRATVKETEITDDVAAEVIRASNADAAHDDVSRSFLHTRVTLSCEDPAGRVASLLVTYINCRDYQSVWRPWLVMLGVGSLWDCVLSPETQISNSPYCRLHLCARPHSNHRPSPCCSRVAKRPPRPLLTCRRGQRPRLCAQRRPKAPSMKR